MQQLDIWLKENENIREYREEIGNIKKKISESENIKRNTHYYWVRQWISNNLDIEVLKSFDDSMSNGQIKSKKWLCEELSKIKFSEPIHIEIIGGWFGYPMIEMLSKIFEIKQIDYYDIDKNCKKVLAQYITHFKPTFKIAIFDDYFDRFEIRRRQLIINTSSEHMKDINSMYGCYKDYPEKPIVAIQSNNFKGVDDHINCVESSRHLMKKSKLNTVLFQGQQDMDLYKRFMVIGQW
jgi:hypothetical protein